MPEHIPPGHGEPEPRSDGRGSHVYAEEDWDFEPTSAWQAYADRELPWTAELEAAVLTGAVDVS